VHLRRALILFAIVLGLSALVASVSRPRDQAERTSPRPTTRQPTATQPPPRPAAARIVFPAGPPARRRLEAERPAVVVVEAPGPGQVEISGLGLAAPADRLTPARFDVLTGRTGRYEVRFTPAKGGESRVTGRLLVIPRRR
jgi:hypothetical protein